MTVVKVHSTTQAFRYSNGRKNFVPKWFIPYIVGKLLTQGWQKSSHFLCRVTIGQNVIIICVLNLFWTVTSEPMKISRILLLWAGYDLGIWFEVQPFGYSYATIYLQICLEGNTFLLIFQEFTVFGLQKIVLAATLSLFKSTKPYLWSRRLIFHEKPKQLCSNIFEDEVCDFFIKSTLNFGFKNVTAWSL